ncbi:hypothetical protein BST61_g2228 [Cercospora zeina]
MSHDAFGQHTAADLLRQSLMHGKTTMADDDHHDQIGSGASTPPNGTATPRPDAHHDKRFPQLVNSYFAQEVESEKPRPMDTTLPPQQEQHEQSAAVAALNHALAGGDQALPNAAQTQLPTAPSSPRSGRSSQWESPPLLPHEKKHAQSTEERQSSLPTPPLSNSSSVLQMADVLASSSGADPRASLDRKASRGEQKRSPTGVPSRLRSNTLSTALNSIVTLTDAPAAHISNPSSDAATAPDTSSDTRSTTPPRSPIVQEKGKKVLTQGEHQNTPPQTPRSGSLASRTNRDDVASASRAAKSSRSSSSNSQGAVIGSLRGQLEVCIEEGRGLRPSTDPYVVCIFQLNEDISGGPKEDEMAVDDEKPQDESLAKGVAMKRMGSGQGAPMAIPGLKSRQTSQTNIADLRRGSHNKQQETTDPVWRHKATFDVVGDNNEIDISVPTMQNQFKGFTFVDESTLEQQYAGHDVESADNNLSRTFSNRAGDRMSGLEPTSAKTDNADADFNHGMLDDI